MVVKHDPDLFYMFAAYYNLHHWWCCNSQNPSRVEFAKCTMLVLSDTSDCVQRVFCHTRLSCLKSQAVSQCMLQHCSKHIQHKFATNARFCDLSAAKMSMQPICG